MAFIVIFNIRNAFLAKRVARLVSQRCNVLLALLDITIAHLFNPVRLLALIKLFKILILLVHLAAPLAINV